MIERFQRWFCRLLAQRIAPADVDDAPPARGRPRARRAAGDPVGVGGRDLWALRLRDRGARSEPDRTPPRGAAAARPPAGDPLRAGPAADHVEHMRAVYERVRGERPGLLDLPGRGGTGACTTPSRGATAHPLRALIVPDGYVLYAVRPGHDDEGARGRS